MSLPENPKMSWPPTSWADVYRDYEEWDAWYAGDPTRLAEVYSKFVYTPTPRGRFWSQQVDEERRLMLHVPIAGDISRVSADFLFSEAPRFRIPEAHAEGAPSDAKQAQDRLDEILDQAGILNRLITAADTASALGGVFLKPNWDSDLVDYPVLSVAQADAAVPEFQWGILRAVTFWRDLDSDENAVYRHLERHEIGSSGRAIILHGLYRGNNERLGMRLSLDSHPETLGLDDVVETPIKGLDVRYIPNMLPNRRRRGTHPYLGQSDYSSLEGLMDALDEAWTSWLRDIRLAKGRVIVKQGYLNLKSDGAFAFDIDKEIFVELNVSPEDPSSAMTPVQFAIRTEEHQKACMTFMERIITSAGYSPQSFGLRIEGRAESGTALRIRERGSFVTTGKKQKYWATALADVLEMLLVIDRETLNNGTPLYRPSVEFADTITPDVTELSTAVDLMHRAEAASVETKVRLLHPDWTEEQVAAEVQRIKEEQGMTMPDPMQTGVS